jgi:hypothetical protein
MFLFAIRFPALSLALLGAGVQFRRHFARRPHPFPPFAVAFGNAFDYGFALSERADDLLGKLRAFLRLRYPVHY